MKPQPNYLYQAQARIAVIHLGLFQIKKKKSTSNILLASTEK